MKIGLIGKTNVGKSTLFNRLLGNYRVIVSETHSTTREIICEQSYIGYDKYADLSDSPGLDDFDAELVYIKKIIDESDILIFVVDGKDNLGPKDQEVKNLILKSGKKSKTILVVNKLDGKVYGKALQNSMAEFYSLGFENMIGICAKAGDNLDGLQEMIIKIAERFKLKFDEPAQKDYTPIAIIGRPNVGKSTLLNKFTQQELSKVSPEHGTTLDYIVGDFTFQGKKFRLYDTAGIRKKGKIHGLERIALEKTLKMLEFIRPLVVFMVDGIEGITHRDQSLLGDITKLNLPIMIVVNKVDEIEKSEFDRKFEQIKYHFNSSKWVPIIPISAKNGTNLPKVLEFAQKIAENASMRIPTSQINDMLHKAWVANPPKFPKNKICKFYYASQVDVNPPKFLIFVNDKTKMNFNFSRWVENHVRKTFGFVGIPVIFEFKNRKNEHNR